MGDGAGGPSGRRTKVERVIDAYDLSNMEAELVSRWTAPDETRESLRELADFFNESLLEATLQEENVDVLDGEFGTLYRLLTDDEVSAGRRTETRSRLEHEGVDVEALESDFVSHQAIHTYLTERQNIEFDETTDGDRVEKARSTVRKLVGRVESVTENTIDRLAATDNVTVGHAEVILSLDVVCNECGTRRDFETFLDRGACDCVPATDTRRESTDIERQD